ncbi:hypothetical protein CPB85DRAFT_402990 [Mucidula mucida]|nr:hypothetical protein CPB85DRAFT_402990 [Mucidula mucida]
MRSGLTFLLLATVAYAQNTITVKVGGEATTDGGIFQFIPPSVNGSEGDIVMFQFTGAPGNHSITQSTFSDPCDPMDGGFDSGWVFIPENGVGETPVWNLTITDASTPLWFFCKQLIPSPHCIAGMVGAINPPASGSNSFQAFQSNAHGFTGTPGVCDFLILRIFSNRGIFACSKELVLSLGAVRRRRRFQVRLPMALCWLGPRLLRRRLRVAQVPVVVRRRAAGLLLRPVRIHQIPR